MTVPHRLFAKIFWSFGTLIACLHLLGCSDEVPIAPVVEGPFAMYGIVNPEADTQGVIVYATQHETLRPIGPEPLDAVVTSKDLETGRLRVWRDSVVADDPSGYSHIFWSDFRAQRGHTYRIEVSRSDGAASAAQVSVPGTIRVEAEDDGRPLLHVGFRGGRFRLTRLEVSYGVGVDDVADPACRQTPRFYTFSYAGRETRLESGWDLSIDLREYLQPIRAFLVEDLRGIPAHADVSFYGLRLDLLVADEAWVLPRGHLDWNAPRLEHGLDWTLLMHPDLLTNVENGLGFVGAGYRTAELLNPSADALRRAGFIDCARSAAGP